MTVNLINVVWVLTVPLTGHFSSSVPRWGLFISGDTTISELGQLIRPTMVFLCSNEKNSHMSLIEIQKLEMAQLIKEDMLKAKDRLRARLLARNNWPSYASKKSS